MGKQASMNKFNKLLNDAASVILTHVQSDVKKKWNRAFVEILWPPTGVDEGGLGKLGVQLPNGTPLCDLDPPIRSMVLMKDAWKVQRGLFPQTWYGIKLSVFPDGKCETEFDYDRDCLEKRGDAFLDT